MNEADSDNDVVRAKRKSGIEICAGEDWDDDVPGTWIVSEDT